MLFGLKKPTVFSIVIVQYNVVSCSNVLLYSGTMVGLTFNKNDFNMQRLDGTNYHIIRNRVKDDNQVRPTTRLT